VDTGPETGNSLGSMGARSKLVPLCLISSHWPNIFLAQAALPQIVPKQELPLKSRAAMNDELLAQVPRGRGSEPKPARASRTWCGPHLALAQVPRGCGSRLSWQVPGVSAVQSNGCSSPTRQLDRDSLQRSSSLADCAPSYAGYH